MQCETLVSDQNYPKEVSIKYCHVLCVCDYRRGNDWGMNLLATLYTTRGSYSAELQVIRYLSLTSTLYKLL
jgi:hypothetical protein